MSCESMTSVDIFATGVLECSVRGHTGFCSVDCEGPLFCALSDVSIWDAADLEVRSEGDLVLTVDDVWTNGDIFIRGPFFGSSDVTIYDVFMWDRHWNPQYWRLAAIDVFTGHADDTVTSKGCDGFNRITVDMDDGDDELAVASCDIFDYLPTSPGFNIVVRAGHGGDYVTIQNNRGLEDLSICIVEMAEFKSPPDPDDKATESNNNNFQVLIHY